MKRHALVSAVVLGLFGAACTSSLPPNELQDARAAYQRAARAPNANLVPTQMREAKEALAQAEKEFEDEGNDASTRDLAYIAQRKAVSANAAAAAASALQSKQMALADLERAKEQHAAAAQAQLEQANKRLTETSEKLRQEESARTAAEQRAQAALAKIEGLQSKESDKGLVLTLSGSVLFASGQSQLLPAAKKRLTEVAKAIREDNRKILIVGHTDSQGAEDKNIELSQRRADAVKTFLAVAGVPNDRMQTEGMGEAEPVASNDSAEGRANNRRVEIVLQKGEQKGEPKQKPTP